MIPDPNPTTNYENDNTLKQNGETTSHKSKYPTFKTEITLEVNRSNSSSDNEDDIVILRSAKKTIINKSAYSKLHKLPSSANRLSTTSLSTKYENPSDTTKIIPPSSDKNLTQPANKSKTISDEDTDEFIPCIIRSESVDTVHKIEKELSNFVMDNKKKDKKRTNSFRKLFSVPFFSSKDKKKKGKETNVAIRTESGAIDNYQNEANTHSFNRNTPQRHTVGCDHFKNRTNHRFLQNNEPKRTIEEEPPPEVIRKYADSHINKFNKIRQSFESPDDTRLNTTKINSNGQNISNSITKYIDTSSSSTLESDRINTYQNALIAQAELQQARQERHNMFSSTDERARLIRNNSLRRDTPPRAQEIHQPVNIVKPRARLPINSERSLPNPYQNGTEDEDLKVLNNAEDSPKLSDIYGTVFDAVPGRNKCSTKVEEQHEKMSPIPKSPRSPSLEGSKLKLPPNREILQPRMKSPLPSAKVSTEKIIATELLRNSNSLEKDSKRNSFVSQNLQEIHISTPNTDKSSVSEAINALRTKLEENDQNLKQELDQIRYTLQNLTHTDSQVGQETNTLNSIKMGNSINTNSPRSTLAPSSRSSVAMSPQTVASEQSYGSLNRQNNLSPAQQNTLSRFSDHSSNIQNVSPSSDLMQQNSSPVHQNENRESTEVELRKKNTGKRVSSSNAPVSPSKDEIRKSVEAYYWKEIKRIKDKEDYEIYLSQLQLSHYGYNDYPFQSSRRSRDVADVRGRRSSSVPRNSRQQLTFDNTLIIPEGASVMYKPHGQNIYGYIPQRLSRMDFARGSVSSMSNFKRNDSVDYGTYKPIFRRGSLSGNATPQPVQLNKKVSFSNSQQTQNSWPTKNGFTKSPPQRRLEKIADNNTLLEDDVFLPPHQAVQYDQQYVQRVVIPDKHLNYNSDTSEPLYGNRNNRTADIYSYNNMVKRAANFNSNSDAVYGRMRQYRTMSQQEMENLRNLQSKDVRPTAKNHNNMMPRPMPTLTRHESIQLPDPSYGYAVQYGRQPSSVDGFIHRNQNVAYQQASTPRRNILITDEVYGQHIGYQNSTAAGSIYGYASNVEPLYGGTKASKQITVRNKVCDIYGKIHDLDSVSREIQATGVLMGQIQDSPTSPVNFRRGTRLTASSHEMNRRRIDSFEYSRSSDPNNAQVPPIKGAPIRPLPPLPPTGRVPQNDNNSKDSIVNVKKSSTNSSKKKKK